MVTNGLLFALKGGRFRAFYRWLDANCRSWFPALREYIRFQRLLRDYAGLALDLLAEPTFFTVVDTYGIELIHPRRAGHSTRTIGTKGTSNGRWIVGIKRVWLINDQGEVVDRAGTTANEADNVFRPLPTGDAGETIALADWGVRAKDAPRKRKQAI